MIPGSNRALHSPTSGRALFSEVTGNVLYNYVDTTSKGINVSDYIKLVDPWPLVMFVIAPGNYTLAFMGDALWHWMPSTGGSVRPTITLEFDSSAGLWSVKAAYLAGWITWTRPSGNIGVYSYSSSLNMEGPSTVTIYNL